MSRVRVRVTPHLVQDPKPIAVIIIAIIAVEL